MQIDPNRLYTLAAVAEIIGVSAPYVRGLIADGLLKDFRPNENGRPRIFGHSLIAFLAAPPAGEIAPPAETVKP